MSFLKREKTSMFFVNSSGFLPFWKRFTYCLHQHKKCPKTQNPGADKNCLQNIQKVLDLCGFYGYYMSRYSGIVQSVEQRTVNPYVTGSSPVARATIYVAKSLISRRFFFHFSLYIFRKNTIKKHLNSARYNHKIIHLLYGIFSIAGQNRYTRIYKAFRMLLNCWHTDTKKSSAYVIHLLYQRNIQTSGYL